jgi:hypothetical protein
MKMYKNRKEVEKYSKPTPFYDKLMQSTYWRQSP